MVDGGAGSLLLTAAGCARSPLGWDELSSPDGRTIVETRIQRTGGLTYRTRRNGAEVIGWSPMDLTLADEKGPAVAQVLSGSMAKDELQSQERSSPQASTCLNAEECDRRTPHSDLSLPGGFVRADEEVETAAMRALRVEAGLEAPVRQVHALGQVGLPAKRERRTFANR